MSNTEEKERGIVIIGAGNFVTYTITPHLRFKLIEVKNGFSATYLKQLQQKWQGSDGSEKWEDIEVVS
jgi:hypothetical protein